MIDISNCDKAAVLKALYDHSKPLGLGMLHFNPPPLDLDEARAALSKDTYFDYYKGRVLKVDLSGADLDPRLYDRDNGQGAALAALKQAGVIQ